MSLWCPCQAKKTGIPSTSRREWRGGPQFQIICGYAELKRALCRADLCYLPPPITRTSQDERPFLREGRQCRTHRHLVALSIGGM